MDLSTTYLGLHLSSPIMPGASPLVDDLDMVKRLEDAGAAAIVMHSLFEEQITGDKFATIYHMELYADAFPEALGYFPRPREYALGPDQYLQQIARIKDAVRVPVIASLNGVTPGGWVDYARLIEQAGADALELNCYFVATVAFGAKDTQTVKAMLEAESFRGPSLIIAYSHCIAHGYDLMFGAEQQRLAVESGIWPLYRFDPRKADAPEGPLSWDSPPVKAHIGEYLKNEARFRMTEALDAERYRGLVAQAKTFCERRATRYQQIGDGYKKAAAAVAAPAAETPKNGNGKAH